MGSDVPTVGDVVSEGETAPCRWPGCPHRTPPYKGVGTRKLLYCRQEVEGVVHNGVTAAVRLSRSGPPPERAEGVAPEGAAAGLVQELRVARELTAVWADVAGRVEGAFERATDVERLAEEMEVEKSRVAARLAALDQEAAQLKVDYAERWKRLEAGALAALAEAQMERGEAVGAAGELAEDLAQVTGKLADLQARHEALEASRSALAADLDVERARAAELEARLVERDRRIEDLEAVEVRLTLDLEALEARAAEELARARSSGEEQLREEKARSAEAAAVAEAAVGAAVQRAEAAAASLAAERAARLTAEAQLGLRSEELEQARRRVEELVERVGHAEGRAEEAVRHTETLRRDVEELRGALQVVRHELDEATRPAGPAAAAMEAEGRAPEPGGAAPKARRRRPPASS
jgi:chromosome segregation ATPase